MASGQSEESRAKPPEADLWSRAAPELIAQANFGAMVIRPNPSLTEFVVVAMNPAAEEMEGARAGVVVGRDLLDAFPYTRQSGLPEILAQVARDGIARPHQTRLYEDGRLAHCHIDHVVRLAGGLLAVAYVDDTQRARAEEELRTYAHGIAQSIDGIGLADLSGRLTFVNPALAEMHGLTVGELTGEPISVMHNQEQLASEVDAMVSQVRETGSFLGEIAHRRKDGTAFPTIMSMTAFRDGEGEVVGMLAVVRDITRRKQAEHSLRLLGTAVREVRDGVMITRRGGRWLAEEIVFANDGFEALTGYPASQAAGLTPADVIRTVGEAPALELIDPALASGGASEGHCAVLRADGTPFVLEWHISPVSDDLDLPTHHVAIFHDVTARERAKEARVVSEQMATITRTALAYNHEVNNPLAAIQGHAELLLSDENDPDRREALEAILRNAARIADVTRRIDELPGPVFTKYLGEKLMLDLQSAGARGETG